LANPGDEYRGTRHNVGGEAVRLAASRRGLSLKSERRQKCEAGTLVTSEGNVTLAVPTTFMNDSGSAVAPLLKRVSLGSINHLVVVHDELDLEPGRLQIKVGGGLAGHNGLRSIAGVVGDIGFARLRIGIGKPPSRERGADWVLRRLTGAARNEIENIITDAADAIDEIIDHGIEAAQRVINAS
jgi:PTH1 family peptidyl-tRNA hydrolase